MLLAQDAVEPDRVVGIVYVASVDLVEDGVSPGVYLRQQPYAFCVGVTAGKMHLQQQHCFVTAVAMKGEAAFVAAFVVEGQHEKGVGIDAASAEKENAASALLVTEVAVAVAADVVAAGGFEVVELPVVTDGFEAVDGLELGLELEPWLEPEPEPELEPVVEPVAVMIV